MSRLTRFILLVLCSVALSGCMDITDVYTINPDGSGKVVHEAVLAQMNMSLDGSSSEPTEESLKKAVLEEIKKAKGIEAWRDVTYEQRGKDKFYFKGTAYFSDLNKLKFHNSGGSINVFDEVSLRLEDGQAVLEIKSSEDDEEETGAENITEENVDEEIAKLQAEYQKTRMMAAGIFSGVKLKRTFYLPGTVTAHSNLVKTEDGGWVSDFAGAKLLEFMDVVMNDEALLRRELLNGHNPLQGGGPADDNKINEYIFGEAAPIEAAFAPGNQPLFDYAAEVAQANADFAPMAEELGAPKRATLKGPEGAHFKVGGVRLVLDSDMENNLRPFNYDEGYAVAIIGRLPQPALSVTEGQLTKAETDHGQDLLPSDEWKRKISFPRLSEDRRKVVFEVDLRRPAESANAIAEISGVLTYTVAEKTRRVDLNINTFTAGTTGSEFGAEIESVGDSQWNPGQQELKLKLTINKDTVKAVDIFDAAGNKLEVSQGYMASGNNVTYNYTLQGGGAFPQAGRIELEVYEDMQTYELPFEIKDVSLLGRKLR